MKYAAISAHRKEFPLALMCRVLGVSRSGSYASAKRAPSARARHDEQLRTQIRAVHQQSRRTYGSPRVHAELRASGERCGRMRVARLMREEGLRVKVRPRRGRPTTTDSRHPHLVAENVLARRFAVTEIACVNRVWAGDITYVPTCAGWLYLAVILDLARLTDDELISLEACFSEAKARGVPVQQLITPELEAAIDKCFSGKGAGA